MNVWRYFLIYFLVMNINKFLFKKSTFYFALFFVFALFAFWPGYYGKLGQEMEPRFHTHGISMTLWCLMLIAQAYLIRINKRKIHKYIGWSSYLMVPLIVGTTINLVHFRLGRAEVLTAPVLLDLALMINSVIVFVILFGLAIYYKKDSLTHARYMICTIFPMFTPITDRLIYRNVRPLVEYAPTIDGAAIVPFFGFILADILLIGLLVWDWKTNKRWKEFGLSLVILVIYQVSVFTAHFIPVWKSFGEWFFTLPLS